MALSYVTSTSGHTYSASSYTTGSVSVNQNDLIVVIWCIADPPAVSVAFNASLPTDTMGNVWYQACNTGESVAKNESGVFYAIAKNAGTTTIDLTCPDEPIGSGSSRALVMVFRGATSWQVDAYSATHNTWVPGTNTVTPSIATTHADVVVAWLDDVGTADSGTAYGVSGGGVTWTTGPNIQQGASDAGGAAYSWYTLPSGVQTVNPTITVVIGGGQSSDYGSYGIVAIGQATKTNSASDTITLVSDSTLRYYRRIPTTSVPLAGDSTTRGYVKFLSDTVANLTDSITRGYVKKVSDTISNIAETVVRHFQIDISTVASLLGDLATKTQFQSINDIVSNVNDSLRKTNVSRVLSESLPVSDALLRSAHFLLSASVPLVSDGVIRTRIVAVADVISNMADSIGRSIGRVARISETLPALLDGPNKDTAFAADDLSGLFDDAITNKSVGLHRTIREYLPQMSDVVSRLHHVFARFIGNDTPH